MGTWLLTPGAWVDQKVALPSYEICQSGDIMQLSFSARRAQRGFGLNKKVIIRQLCVGALPQSSNYCVCAQETTFHTQRLRTCGAQRQQKLSGAAKLLCAEVMCSRVHCKIKHLQVSINNAAETPLCLGAPLNTGKVFLSRHPLTSKIYVPQPTFNSRQSKERNHPQSKDFCLLRAGKLGAKLPFLIGTLAVRQQMH